jgi:hypothetical protein
MSFLRPEAREALSRWREVLVGIGILLLGVYGAAKTHGPLFYLSLLAVPAALALIWEGIRRARFPGGGDGPGMVEVNERQITYFGPGGGASVSIDALVRVEVVTTDAGPFGSDLFWAFHSHGAPPLLVPGDAVGAEGLFDALTALPGVDFGRVTEAMGSTEPDRFVIWSSTNADPRLS